VPKLRFPEYWNKSTWSFLNGDLLFDQIDRRPAQPGLPILAITQEHGAISRDEIDYHVSVTDASIASYKEVRPGDFIISLRSFQGGIEFSRVHGVCSPAYVILGRKGDGSDDFYRYLFKSERFIQQITRNIEGLRDGKMISYRQFSEQMLPAPELAEQKKIAECLTSLDELLGAQALKLESLRKLKRGLMRDLFPREAESLARLRFPEFCDAVEWQQTSLSKISTISSGTTPLRSQNEFYASGTIPWVKTGDLNNSIITDTEEQISSLAKARINPPGSVLVAMYGGFNQIGRTGLLAIPAATNQAISVLIVQSHIVPEFLLAWLNAKVGLWKRIASSSRKDPNITSADVGAFPFSVPTKPEQRQIAACLASLDILIAEQSKKLGALKTHKQGLMQGLFPSPEAGRE